MKRYALLFASGLLVLTALAAPHPAQLAAQTRASTMYIAVKEAEVKSGTGLLAEKRGTVVYGEQVSVLQIDGKWSEIRSAGQNPISGWVSTTALTSRRIVAGGAIASASASDIALAGKGFSARTEQTYKDAGSLNYAQVDLVEAETVSYESMYDFLTVGHLKTGE
jgi:SH3-like domain-containing protein